MEENNKKCDCLLCRHGKHTWFRWILGIVILWAIFALGVKIGEFKYMVKDGLRGSYYGMMGGYGDSYGSYGCGRGGNDSFFSGMMGQNMMNYWNSQLRNATSTK